MTFDQYIKNPMSSGNRVFTQKNVYEQLYASKFNNLIAREGGDIKFHLIKDSDKKYIVHILMPSEPVHNFYYDTVIEFGTDSTTLSKDAKTLNEYDIRVYSNDPAFTFTFTYAFHKHKMFITDLKNKVNEKALTQESRHNPNSDIGYAKSIYFAYLFCKWKNLFQKSTWDGYTLAKKSDVYRRIVHADKKISARQEKGIIAKQQDLARRKEGKLIADNDPNNTTPSTKSVSKTPKTKTTPRTKVMKKKR